MSTIMSSASGYGEPASSALLSDSFRQICISIEGPGIAQYPGVFPQWDNSPGLQHKGDHTIKFLVCVSIVLYTQRRSAIAALILGLMIGNIILYHDGRLEKKQILMDLGIVWGFFVCVLLYEAQITALIQRVSAIGEAVSGRSGNWKENLATISTDIFLGRGMVLLLCGRSADFLKTGTGKLL